MTATAEPTTQPAPGPVLVMAGRPMRTWQVRRSEEVVMQVWRVIANSGARGISPADIRSRLNDIAEDVLKQHLHELRRKGHTRFDSPTGSNRVGCWVATSKLPLNQVPPLWMQDLDDSRDNDGAHATDQAAKGSAAVEAARAGDVPNSVFALGEAAAQAAGADFGMDIDAVHMPAQRSQAQADAAPPEPPAEPEEPAPPAPPEAAAEAATPAPPAEDQPQAAAPERVQPLFSLQSDGTLAGTLEDGRVLRMSANDTRHLFAFLDRLMAIGHGSLSEAAS